MTDLTSRSYSLIRGCALFAERTLHGDSYLLGTLERVAKVTSPFQRSALVQLAAGQNPFTNIPPQYLGEIEQLVRELEARGFLNRVRSELAPPKRYLSETVSRDQAVIQLRTRSAPELAHVEWVDTRGDGGVSTLAARSEFILELSGRSRVITILYSMMLASGVTRVRLADRFYRSEVTDLDIGSGPLTARDLGLNYYQQLSDYRRGLSLFPIAIDDRPEDELSRPGLTVHYGDCDPEVLIEWSQRNQPYLLIHPPIGDEIVIGPLVLPGRTPCHRCLSLYEIDHWGYTRSERIPLTPVDDLPMVIAHYIAALVGAQILHFIDGTAPTGGNALYINYQRLTSPQVVAIARHPLCGCDL